MSVKLSRRIREFTDISLAFQPNPVTGDITLLKDDRAVRNSLKNCVMTATKEAAFNPLFGSVVNELLFETDDAFTRNDIQLEVERAIKFNEPRVEVKEVRVQGTTSAENELVHNDNTVKVLVIYQIIGYEEVFNTEFILTPTTTP